MDDGLERKNRYLSVVPAVEQTAKILSVIAASPGSKANLTDICKAVGIYKSKGYAILNTLQTFGLVLRDAEGKQYSLGPGLISLGHTALENLSYKDLAKPFLEELARTTRSTALFGMVVGDRLFVVAQRQADQDFGVTLRPGRAFPLTYGAHGKAIVAFMEEGERNRILAGKKLFFHGHPTALDRRRLDAELEGCRRRGFAEDLGEVNPMINIVGAPVLGPDGNPMGSLFIVGLFPASAVKVHGPRVAENARKLSALMGAGGVRPRARNGAAERSESKR